MKVYNSVEELIGNTPLLRLNKIEKLFSLKAKLFAKLEKQNPAGSVKDRVALYMINDAEKRGLIKAGGTVIEPTSGNTGIGLASICAKKGYRLILTMPSTMSIERVNLLKAYGANVVLTDGLLGMKGAIEVAKKIASETENSIIIGQFDNKANPTAHYETTGKEIYSDLDGKVDVFISCVGTGGTFSGTSKYLKEQNPKIKTVAVEPANSPLISKGKVGAHKIQGIGANFIPDNFDKTLADDIATVKDEKAFELAKTVAREEGILVGISSGGALAVAIEYAKKEENSNKNIVIIFPDSGERYLSTGLYE